MLAGKRIALVHDYIVAMRGGEQVLLALSRMFPAADQYALLSLRSPLPGELSTLHPRTTPLQWIPYGARNYRLLLPLYPYFARRLDLRGYDLVISSSSGFCHAAHTEGVHICYCHTPLRYAWHEHAATLATQRSALRRAALAGVLGYVRRADYAAAQRVTAYLANSAAVRARIKSYYGRDSQIVYPFVDTEIYQPAAEHDAYLLVVSRLHTYKRVDLAIQASAQLGRRLVIVGEGPERARLERLAGPDVTFLGHVARERLATLYARCAALLQCGEEDFGIAALEAQAAGRPVVAFDAGGALDTVLDGTTGIRFPEQTVAALEAALRRLETTTFDPLAIRAHAERFDEAHFRDSLWRAIQRIMDEASGGGPRGMRQASGAASSSAGTGGALS